MNSLDLYGKSYDIVTRYPASRAIVLKCQDSGATFWAYETTEKPYFTRPKCYEVRGFINSSDEKTK